MDSGSSTQPDPFNQQNNQDMDKMHHPYNQLHHPVNGGTEELSDLSIEGPMRVKKSPSSGAIEPPEQFSWFTAGDLSAFVALTTNNMATMLAVVGLLLPKLGPDIVFGRIVPGVGWATLFGNLYYTWMAWRLRRAENRVDICAQPYGINTPGAFAFVFSLMLPDFNDADPSIPLADRQEHSWRVGIGANLVASAILLFGAIVGRWISRNVSLVPLFTSLSGIAVAYLCFGSLFDEFAHPIIGFFCLAIFFAEYFGGIRFYLPGTNIRLPTAVLVLVLGSALGWADGLVHGSDIKASGAYIKAYAPMFTLFDMFKHIDLVKSSISIIVPTAVTVAIGTIQCVTTAHEAGDMYSVRDSMIGDGIGTLIGAITGSPLGMTVYIGHPGYKRMGARTGYSIVTAIVFWVICVFGLIAPLNEMIVAAAVNPILVSIGLDITTETIKIAPHRHIPAVIMGLLPSLANWAQTSNGDNVGINAMGNGGLMISMFITAIFIHLIDRNFRSIAIWSTVGAFLSFFGLIHSSEVGWLVAQDDISWRFAIAYLMVATLAVIGHVLQSQGSIDPMRPEALDEQIEFQRKEYEQEQQGLTAQTNACCSCV